MPSIRPSSSARRPVQNSPLNSVVVVALEPGAARARTCSLKPSWMSPCKRVQPRDVLGVLRPERVEQRLALAGGVDAPLDAERCDQLLEAEAGADHADRADDRGCVGEDLVGGAGQPVAARGRHVLDEGKHRQLLLVGQRADAPGDQRRLHRRAAGRVDRERHRLEAAEREGALQRRRRGRRATARRASGRRRADHAASRRTTGDDRRCRRGEAGEAHRDAASRSPRLQRRAAAVAQDRLGRRREAAVGLVQHEAGGQPRRRARRPCARARARGSPGRLPPGHSGKTTISPARAAQRRQQIASSRSARWIKVSVPLGRAIARQKRDPVGEVGLALDMRGAAALAVGGVGARPRSRKGGLVMTWSKALGASRGGGRSRSPTMTSTRPAKPLTSTLSRGQPRRGRAAPRGRRTRQPGTRAARQSAAAPVPQPTSSTSSPGPAGTAAASSTGSIATR